MLTTLRLKPDEAGIFRAAELLRAGELVAFPSETVYGLGGDARNDAAVAGIYTAKGRPSFNPLIVHLPDLDAVRRYAEVGPEAEALARAFWPGPLTLVLPLRPDAGLSPRVTAGNHSLAVRIPAHPVARALLQVSGVPLAGPSANPSGRISPTTAEHVLEGLDGRIAAVLDGGACRVGVESTILAPGQPPHLLRPGGISAEEILAVLGTLPLRPEEDPARPVAPGQLSSHYAPDALVRLNAGSRRANEVFIGFGAVGTGAEFNLSPTGDLNEAAAQLFAVLRDADRQAGPGGRIAIAPVPTAGIGLAINDRLKRAAAPRS
ncbi:L-threonylcarbamoyladenylate synthase [Falsigemmobacter faecalis]|uniref:Threonylcarbamoyl-AMP synthase n=1 Tax=Falsigemmobacter faecalis TaxID=2488730 RepID=A0A3P3DWA0_9RHOB|nr:L-threonylcarbamoyladenylate synthase [Falsigemmobacter faecalis]RRH78459.1 threonylcarbamoyl-AMP synthase [Falsigemmobacter faecalis]